MTFAYRDDYISPGTPFTSENVLLALYDFLHPPWQQAAACKGADPDIFYPGRGAGGPYMQMIRDTFCNDCPVRQECLDAALADKRPGIWGGTSERDRRNIRFSTGRYGHLRKNTSDLSPASARKRRLSDQHRADGWCYRCADGNHTRCRRGHVSCACPCQLAPVGSPD